MNNKKYNPFADMYNFNANSNNWVQRLGHNADFYNNPLGYNSSPTPRPYDNTTASGADDDNEVISGFRPQTPRTTSLNNGFNVNKQQPSMGNMSSFNLKGNNTSEFNTGSNNWVQRLGHNADFYNNPLGYNSSPTPRPYKIASNDIPVVNNNKKVDYSAYGEGFSKEFIDNMLDDKEYQKILDEYIIPNEGGYVNRPNDLGGETKYGISSRWYPNEDIKNLTRERANAIIYRDFYKWNGLYRLPYPIRGAVVDYGMPTSPLNAIRTVHEVLDLPVRNGDIIGPLTLEKFKNYSERDYIDFLEKYKQHMYKYYNSLVDKDTTQLENLTGWLNRANKIHIGK